MSVNKIILVGHLGRDLEVRYLPTGAAVCNFSIATTEKWTSNGQPQEHTEWHRIQAWGKLGEACGQYLKKGKQVYIEGRVRTREYEGKDGQKRRSTEVIAQTVQFLGSKSDGANGGGRPEYDDAREPMGAESPPSQDEDIPF